MPRTKQTARAFTGTKAPRLELATKAAKKTPVALFHSPLTYARHSPEYDDEQEVSLDNDTDAIPSRSEALAAEAWSFLTIRRRIIENLGIRDLKAALRISKATLSEVVQLLYHHFKATTYEKHLHKLHIAPSRMNMYLSAVRVFELDKESTILSQWSIPKIIDFFSAVKILRFSSVSIHLSDSDQPPMIISSVRTSEAFGDSPLAYHKETIALPKDWSVTHFNVFLYSLDHHVSHELFADQDEAEGDYEDSAKEDSEGAASEMEGDSESQNGIRSGDDEVDVLSSPSEETILIPPILNANIRHLVIDYPVDLGRLAKVFEVRSEDFEPIATVTLSCYVYSATLVNDLFRQAQGVQNLTLKVGYKVDLKLVDMWADLDWNALRGVSNLKLAAPLTDARTPRALRDYMREVGVDDDYSPLPNIRRPTTPTKSLQLQSFTLELIHPSTIEAMEPRRSIMMRPDLFFIKEDIIACLPRAWEVAEFMLAIGGPTCRYDIIIHPEPLTTDGCMCDNERFPPAELRAWESVFKKEVKRCIARLLDYKDQTPGWKKVERQGNGRMGSVEI